MGDERRYSSWMPPGPNEWGYNSYFPHPFPYGHYWPSQTASLPVQSSDTLVDQAAARPVTPGSNNQSPSTPESATASDEFCSTPSPTDSISVDKQVSALRTHY